MINSEPSSWQFNPPSESLRFRNVSPVKDLVLQHTTFLPLLSLCLFPSHIKHIQDGRLFIKNMELALGEEGNSNSDSGTCTLNHERQTGKRVNSGTDFTCLGNIG